ncbi:EscU/YscU/HrcU family type III secretion system export apparatus switch protein [Sulfurimonas sp. HSL3-2]|uniref:EscU/YscU/HrcU family type III secretion system export apparatus switch protein n=1 Tax=Hydrocurvibacter mobilis TaxID=3131936 RepID=UPI0031F8F57A
MHNDKAVALKYDQEKNTAPKVVASGKGELAQRIIQKAKEYNVPIFSNPELASSLIDLDLDKEIPSQLYQAVADVFIWLMKNESKH